MDEPQRNSGAHLKLENIETIRKILDVEILHTYSVGLLSVCLTFGCLRMKDALTTYGLPVMLMRYLRSGVLGELKKTAFDAALIWKLTMPKTDIGEVYVASFDSLTQLREKACVKCLMVMRKRIESIEPLLHEKAVDISIELLRKSVKIGEGVPLSRSMLYLLDVLKIVGHFAAHRKFVTLFVDRGGMQRVVDVPRNKQTFFSLSLLLFTISKFKVLGQFAAHRKFVTLFVHCGGMQTLVDVPRNKGTFFSISLLLFAICSFKGIMEHVCDLPSNVIERVVELALELLECRDDLSSKNAGSFISSAFSFRAFVRKDGFRKLLCYLQEYVSNQKKAHCTCIALHRYMKAHLHLFVDSILHVSKVRVSYRQLDLSNEAVDVVFRKIQKDQKVGPAFARATSWHAVDEFLRLKGHITLLEMCQNIYRLQDSLPHVLGVLHIVTLIPYSREIIINATVSDGRVGMAVILDAIMTPADVKPEGVEPALHLLINLVCPPQSMTDESNAAIVPHQQASSELEKLEQGYRRILTFERSYYHVGDVSGCNRIRVCHIYLLSLAHCLQIHKFKWPHN
ncbi:hypothetical protein ABFS82_05G121600 [Erythranthe guttata]|uniref:DDB1- and CUL4-associated factor homolog 1-like isoform X3 n=1 Tax=Erythranthe guttata TaxID=4155 RepID=UPI00064DF608|nr:PREDICTED: DDB1- and CUL4-associated factor homolog 1-like isoform X3 [Erythranthe guttata]|eukprot:XP_012847130.1 PREDICTED: DDB1- and CUL4-associated factor homolog 1-like isoform X3 [Erythranthe guttata]